MNIKKAFLLFQFVIIGISAGMAQQLPNAGFEDWSGSTFDGNIQPADWFASNVTQFGFKFNFAHREAGHTGSYSMRVSDQEIGAAGITEVSPGYFTLGQPWVHIPSLTKVGDATAGTHGGINWTYRPDSMSVWIRRTGANTQRERFYMVYYAWIGDSRGDRYKGKNGNCTSVTQKNEESDIRQAMDANECGTAVKVTQVAEGQWSEFCSYNDWTQIRVPIYYMSDETPEKMNIIFSASRYPEQRANTGLYDGNSLYVDDVELIYSDKIQKIYIDDFEWKGFDPNSSEEQVYSLGETATAIPTNIRAYRGAGSLQSANSGKMVNFQGRELQPSEMTITPGALDGAPTLITVTSGDGATTRTYRIKFVRAASTNAKLATIAVNGEALANFKASVPSYSVQLPYGTTATPVVTAEAQDAGATVDIQQPAGPTGTATITVTAADGATVMTYVLNLSVALLSDNTLADITVNGQSIPGFTPATTIYRVSLPLGTTDMPDVQAVSAYPAGEQTIRYTAPAVLDGGQYKIEVTTPGNPIAKVYKLNFRLEASDYAYLRDLQMDGGYIQAFDPQQLTYYVNLPLGTTALPQITYTTGDPYQTVEVVPEGLDGTTRVVVTAGNGSTQVVYKLVVTTEKSTRSDLSMIYVGGVPVEGFSAEQLNYAVTLPVGTTVMPDITVDPGDEYETIRILSGGLNGTTRITVTAGDGSATIYQLALSVLTSSDATLGMIYLDGTALEGFDSAVLEYTIVLPKGTSTLPVVTYDPHDAMQTITPRAPMGVSGDYRLTVRPQTGASQTYVLHFVVETSSCSTLQQIAVGGTPLADFDPEQTDYQITLPEGVSTIPTVTYTRGDNEQRVLQVQNGHVITLTVTAGDGSRRVYTLTFIVQKSENALLRMIYLNGVELEGFDPAVLAYTDSLDRDSLCPKITVDSEEGQQVIIVAPYSTGVAKIVVTPESGAANTYTITFVTDGGGGDDPKPVPTPSDNCSLASIALDGIDMADFNPSVLDYTRTLPAGSTMPQITFVKADSVASTYCGQREKGQYAITVVAENGDHKTYTIRFTVTPYDNVLLPAIQLEGITLPYDPQTTEYTLSLDMGQELPAISIVAAPGQSVMMTQPDADTQMVLVTAESGRQQTYTVHYERVLSQNALLADILVGGVSLADFDPDTHHYIYPALARGTRVIPSVHPVGQLENQVITTHFCRPGGTMLITVLAQNGQTSAEYTIDFPLTLSSNTALQAIQIDEALNFDFEPSRSDYLDLLLPYGTTATPRIYYDRSETSQQVDYTWAPLDSICALTVTAENGDVRVYRFRFHVQESTLPNRLATLSVNGLNLDPTQLTQTVTLPYGTTALHIEYSKQFAEQTLQVVEGGLIQPTTITLDSHRPGETSATYVITPQIMSYDPAVLQGLRVDGVPVVNFAPDRFRYVVSVASQPTVTEQHADSVSVVRIEEDSKHVAFRATCGNYSHIYTVVYYYVNDVIPGDNFNQWSSTQYDGGTKPAGWKAPSDACDSYSWGSQGAVHPGLAVSAGGSGIASLNSVQDREYNSIYGTVPGMITLGDIQMKLASNGGSSSSISGGIPFRNTPDAISVDYNADYHHNMPNWRMWVELGDGSQVVRTTHTEPYDATGVWATATEALDYGSLGLISSLNITLNSANSDNAADLSNGSWLSPKQHTAVLKVRNLRFLYSSKIASATVDGQTATISGTNITYHIADPEYARLPQLQVVGEVADQMPVLLWSDEQGGVRTAQLRNYAEDGTYTDYTVRITRTLSSNTDADIVVTGGDLQVIPASPHATVQILPVAGGVEVHVVAETGAERIYPVSLTPARSASTELANITAPGLTFVSATREYTITSEQMPEISYTRQLDGQTVVQQGGLLTVTAEDGTVGEYRLNWEQPATTGQLTELELNGSLLPGFSPATYTYEVARPERTAFVRMSDRDSVVFVQSEHQMSFSVYGTEQHTYNLLFPTSLRTEAHLLNLLVAGEPIAHFDPQVYDYTVVSDTALAIQPITAEGQTISATFADGAYTIVVTAEDGVTSLTYRVVLRGYISSAARLSAIMLDGDTVAGFDPEQFSYTVVLPTGEYKSSLPLLPAVSYDVERPGTRVEVQTAHLGQPIYLDVTAEDGIGYAQYQLLIVSAPSPCSSLTGITVNGNPVNHFETGRHYYAEQVEGDNNTIGWTSLDGFQHITVDTIPTATGTLYAIRVQAEDGQHSEVYQVELFQQRLSSDAMLADILLNEMPMSDFYPAMNPGLRFDPNNNLYMLGMPSWITTLPNVSAVQRSEGQTVQITRTNRTITILVTAKDGVTTNTYTLNFLIPQSSNTELSMIYLNGDSLRGFQPDVHFYLDTLAVGVSMLPEVVGQKGEPVQTLGENIVAGPRVTIPVTAEDGTQGQYVIYFTYTLSDADSLQMIYEDGQALPGFQPTTHYYHRLLPVGTTAFPEISWQEADAWQVIDTILIAATDESLAMQISVTSASGRNSLYTLLYEIERSEVDTLQMIYLDNRELPGFSGQKTEYSYLMPADATEIPSVFYVQGDAYQTVTVVQSEDSLAGKSLRQKVSILVEAQCGYRRIYTIHFPLMLSSDALLNGILFGGQTISGFDSETFDYVQRLPEGMTTVPVITVVPRDPAQQVQINYVSDMAVAISTVAEDGVTTALYTIRFVSSDDERNTLNGIQIGGEELTEFSPAVSDYSIELPYGTPVLPEVTYTAGAKGQTVLLDVVPLTDGAGEVTLLVVPANGDLSAENEYTIHFVVAKNSDCTLATIRVSDELLPDFDPAVQDYLLLYGDTCTMDDMFDLQTLSWLTTDSNATAQAILTDNVEHQLRTIIITVTAADGSVGVYTIEQRRVPSSDSRLENIYLNGEPMENFADDVHAYTYWLRQGVTALPEIDAEAVSDYAEVSVMPMPIVGDTIPVLVICRAEDGSDSRYMLYFVQTPIDDSRDPHAEDVIVKVLSDSKILVSTIRRNVSFALFDLTGREVAFLQNILTPDPNNAVTTVDANGNTVLIDVKNLDGDMSSIRANQIYVYCFFESGKYKITSGKMYVR